MIEFVGLFPIFENNIMAGVVMETLHFEPSPSRFSFKNNFISHLGYPNKQLCTHEKLCWGAR